MILVTGATGFLGNHLLEKLATDSNLKIRALTRHLIKIPERYKKENIEWVEADVLDVVALEEAMIGVEQIYHCAAKVSFEAKHYDKIMLINVKGTANVVNLALDAKVKKLVHVSSIASLGRTTESGLITEETKWEDSDLNSKYAISKFLGEREVWRGMQEGLNAVIVNPSIIIGAGDWKKGSARFFYTAKNGMRFYPVGMNGFVDAKDVVNCMIQLMNSKIVNERFIINAENYFYKDLLMDITSALNVRQPNIKIEPWITNIAWRVSSILNKTFGTYPTLTKETANNANNVYRYSNQKIIEALNGYQFKSIKQSVIETAAQFKSSQ
ncbi:MAG: NAD-dependent epimerase/dehydratase family protein [Pseudomonadota bacterium]